MAYPPTAKTTTLGAERIQNQDAVSNNVNIADVLANAKLELELADQRMEKLQTKIHESENQIAEWTKQVESLRVSIQRAYVAQVGYEELLPVAASKQKIAAQRVERLEQSLKKFERQVKLEDYLKELEREEDGKEEYQRYWHEVGDVANIPRPPSIIDDAEFDDLGHPAMVRALSIDGLESCSVHDQGCIEPNALDLLIDVKPTLAGPSPLSPHSVPGTPLPAPSPRRPISLREESTSPSNAGAWSPRTDPRSEFADEDADVGHPHPPSPAFSRPQSPRSSRPASVTGSERYFCEQYSLPSPNSTEAVEEDPVGQLVDHSSVMAEEDQAYLDRPVEETPEMVEAAPAMPEPKVSGKKGGSKKKGKK